MFCGLEVKAVRSLPGFTTLFCGRHSAFYALQLAVVTLSGYLLSLEICQYSLCSSVVSVECVCVCVCACMRAACLRVCDATL